MTRLQIRIYNANLWPAGAAEIKKKKKTLCRDGECLVGAGIVQLWAAVGLWCKFQSLRKQKDSLMWDLGVKKF